MSLGNGRRRRREEEEKKGLENHRRFFSRLWFLVGFQPPQEILLRAESGRKNSSIKVGKSGRHKIRFFASCEASKKGPFSLRSLLRAWGWRVYCGFLGAYRPIVRLSLSESELQRILTALFLHPAPSGLIAKSDRMQNLIPLVTLESLSPCSHS